MRNRLHGNRFSMGAAFCGRCGFMDPSLPKSDPKKSFPTGNLDPLLIPVVPIPPLIPTNGLEKPKNSANMSSALLGLNRNVAGPSPPLKKEAPAPPAPGGEPCSNPLPFPNYSSFSDLVPLFYSPLNDLFAIDFASGSLFLQQAAATALKEKGQGSIRSDVRPRDKEV
ncbi:hypothetical protein M5K25_021300 [Dendrobium thyrsiflorum]|uniref:Uncharacterized protein n=1 Tax=Dendrobium thyrsiflorum TaxID=117978 RepID=A0ABD0UJ10_DENTH